MRVDSANFANLNEAKNRFPRQVVRIDFSGAGDYVYFSSHAGITGLTGDVFHGYLKEFKGNSQKLNNASGIANIGNLNFDIVDVGKDITNKIKTKLDNKKGLRNKEVVLFQGYKDLDFSDFIELQTQNIDRNVSFKDNVYNFNCSDIQRNLKFEIFKLNETKLARSIDESQLYFFAYDEGLEFCTHGANYGDAPNQTVAYMQIDKEVMRITSVVADSSLGEDLFKYTIAERGVFRTDPKAHNFNEVDTDTDKRPKIKEVVYLEMPFPKMVYAILTGTLYNQAGSSFPSNWSINLDTSKVNLSDFLNIGNDWYDFNDDNKGKHLRFIGEKASEAKAFIEEQITQPHLAFLHVYGNGTLGLKRSSSVLYDAPYVAALDKDNIVSYSPLVHNLNQTINRVRVKWDYDFLDGETQREFVLLDDDSITTHEKSPIKTFSYRGIYPAAHTYSTLKVMFDALRDRISNPPLTLQVDIFASLNRLQVGDVVQVDLSQIRDYSGNTTDLKRSFEIQGITFKPKSGVITLQLYGSSAKSKPIKNLLGEPVFTSGFYSSKGTNLNTLTGSTYDSGSDTLTLNNNVTLSGTSNMNDATSTWFCNSNLEIASGVVITIVNNVCFKVKGFFDNTFGKIDGKGNGSLGGIGQYSNQAAAHTYGGFFGVNKAGGGFSFDPLSPDVTYNSIHAQNFPLSNYDEIPALDLAYDGVTTLEGIPIDFRGSGGAGGLGFESMPTVPDALGSDGANGGAGFLLISRGAETGEIDLSGNDSEEGIQSPPRTTIGYSVKFISGEGGGGLAGSFINIIDGSDNLIPNVLDGFVANTGNAINAIRNPVNINSSTISVSSADNSYNDSANNFPIIPIGKYVVVEGFTSSGNNIYVKVLSSTTSKIIVDGTLTNETAGNTIIFKGHRYDYIDYATFGYAVGIGSGFNWDKYINIDTSLTTINVGLLGAYKSTPQEDQSQSRYRIQYAPVNYTVQENAKYAKKVTSISIEEYKNTPKTALGNVSTIEISVGVPVDTGFSHANIYYRLFGTNEWLYVDSTRTSATFTAVSDGLIYEIMARAVSWEGIENDGGVFDSVTVSNLSTDVDQEVLGVPNVSGLEIEGQGNNFEFTGKECKLVWRKSSLNEWYNLGYEPLSQGSGAGGEDLYFKDYKIEVYNISTGNLIRTEYVNDNFYTYTFEKNAEDNNGKAIRTFRIEVKQRSRINVLSLVASKIIPINPEPDLPANVEIKAGWGQVTVSFDTPKDLDYEGLVLYLAKSSVGLIDGANKLTFKKSGGLNETFKLIEEPSGASIVAETNYYLVVGAIDSFGEDNPNLSTTFLVKTNKSAIDRLNTVSDWAKRIDPADRDFISKALSSDAVESEKIKNLTAAKITTGILHATTQITCEGLIKTIGNSGYDLTMGQHTITGTEYVFSFGNGTVYPILIDADGNATFDGSITAAIGVIGGFTISATQLVDSTSSLVLDSSNKSITIGNTAFGSEGVQLRDNSGGECYFGDGIENYFQFTQAGGLREGHDVQRHGTDSFHSKSIYDVWNWPSVFLLKRTAIGSGSIAADSVVYGAHKLQSDSVGVGGYTVSRKAHLNAVGGKGSKYRAIKTAIRIDDVSAGDGYFVTGNFDADTPPVSTYLGFWMDGGVLKAITKKGTGTQFDWTLLTMADNINYVLTVEHNGVDTINFYVGDTIYKTLTGSDYTTYAPSFNSDPSALETWWTLQWEGNGSPAAYNKMNVDRVLFMNNEV